MMYFLIFLVIVLLIGYVVTQLSNTKEYTNKTNTFYNPNGNIQITETDDFIKLTFNNKAGFINGRHYTELAEDVKALKRENKLDEAEGLLLKIIPALIAEAKAEGPYWFIAPWYFEQLAIIYRKQKLIFKEKEILEKYLTLNKISGDGETPLEVRYRKVKELIKKQKQ